MVCTSIIHFIKCKNEIWTISFDTVYVPYHVASIWNNNQILSFQQLDSLERGIVGNGNELFSISNWKNQVGTELENLSYNVTRTESKLEDTNEKLIKTEIKNKRYGTKLARLSKTIQKLHKLTGEIEYLKSQIENLEKVQ